MVLDFVDVSEHNDVFPNLAGQDGFMLRACLANNKDDKYDKFLTIARRDWPDKPLSSYLFLGGPKRGIAVTRQVGFFADIAAFPGGTILDWEEDVYRGADGQTHSYGHQPFEGVLTAQTEARRHGMDPGVYGSLSNFTTSVVKRLLDRRTPLLWIAGYDGIVIPQRIFDQVGDKAILIHQYQGTPIDRSHGFCTAAQWAAFCRWTLPKPIPEPAVSGRVHVRAGFWWDYRVSGDKLHGYSIGRTQSATGGFSAKVGKYIDLPWGGKPRRLAKALSGAYTGSWVDLFDQPEVGFEPAS